MSRKPKGTVVEEYLVKITPYINKDKYVKDMQKFNETVTKRFKKLDKGIEDADRKTKQFSKNMYSTAKSGFDISKAIGATSAKVSVILAAVGAVYELMKKISSEATTFSNKMISASSAFVDKDVRSIMATFGVGSQAATGISSTMGLMGITKEDLKIMTPGQMQLFGKLMNQWTTGMNSIDKSKMEKFNQVVQSFQSQLASSKMELQIQFYKLLVELAPQLEDFFNSIIHLFDGIRRLVSSNEAKKTIQHIMNIATVLVEALTLIANALSLFGGTSNSVKEASASMSASNGVTNNYTVYSTSNNSFSGESASMYNLATNVSEQNNRNLSTALLSTGRV